MGPASTINHVWIDHLLPIVPLPGVDRCRKTQFMTLVLKELTLEEMRCKSPHYYLNSWPCMFKYRMGCRAMKEFQRQEKEGGKGGRRSATVVEERAPAVNGCGGHVAEVAGRNPEGRASGGLSLVQSSRF